MVAVRVFWSQAEAALHKSRLDDHEIFSALLHENAHLYGGAPMAMPIRLLVDDYEAELALCILYGDLEAAAKLDKLADITSLPADITSDAGSDNQNPWELLVMAFYCLLPGWTVLQTKYPVIMQTDRRASRALAAVAIVHFFGWLGVAVAVTLVLAYVHLRRVAASREKDISRRDRRL